MKLINGTVYENKIFSQFAIIFVDYKDGTSHWMRLALCSHRDPELTAPLPYSGPSGNSIYTEKELKKALRESKSRKIKKRMDFVDF